MSYYRNRLLALREERDLKQAAVAAELGMARGTLANYEAGLMPSIENAISLARYYHVSLDYIAGLSSERSHSADTLQESFFTLMRLAGDAAPTGSDVAAVLDAAILYMASGNPCGEGPIQAWKDFMADLAASLSAAASGDVARLLDSANAAAVAALEITKMPAKLATKKE